MPETQIPRRRFSRRQWIVIVLAMTIFAYLVSFGFALKSYDGTLTLEGTPPPPRPVYISWNSTRLNQMCRYFYYPLVRMGENAGWWEFVDYQDIGMDVDGTSLIVGVVSEIWQTW